MPVYEFLGTNQQVERMTTQMVLTALPDIPLIQAGDDLVTIIETGLKRADIALEQGDVLVIAQKIVSKAEGRMVNLDTVQPSQGAQRWANETHKDPRLLELILRESSQVLRTRPGLIIVEHRLGFVCANAGIDRSNVASHDETTEEWVLLLPKAPDQTAEEIRQAFERKYGVKIGVLIIDSHGRAWRMGTAGVAIGVAGFPALMDLRGEPDLFGNLLQVTQVGLADEMAGAASLLMGQADEARPVIHARGLPYELREGSLPEILRPREDDLFR
ncbi:MAG: coenzyme F420-0:L-glutamate ligase [Anaerolineales bacterium]|jgi:coenzyme F420-0:L-glutamate ligase/coenzyme F420-1:gamma-L-glutamate ligase